MCCTSCKNACFVCACLQVLHWLVHHLLSAGDTVQVAQAEVLLAQYCITRRNPLSAVAAIKEAIMQVRSCTAAFFVH
jgi:hypothetical protein